MEESPDSDEEIIVRDDLQAEEEAEMPVEAGEVEQSADTGFDEGSDGVVLSTDSEEDHIIRPGLKEKLY